MRRASSSLMSPVNIVRKSFPSEVSIQGDAYGLPSSVRCRQIPTKTTSTRSRLSYMCCASILAAARDSGEPIGKSSGLIAHSPATWTISVTPSPHSLRLAGGKGCVPLWPMCTITSRIVVLGSWAAIARAAARDSTDPGESPSGEAYFLACRYWMLSLAFSDFGNQSGSAPLVA